jgi:SAM-dependent methyltransferase
MVASCLLNASSATTSSQSNPSRHQQMSKKENQAIHGNVGNSSISEEVNQTPLLGMTMKLQKKEFMAECSAWIEEEPSQYPAASPAFVAYHIFQDLFKAVDAFRLSYKDRRELLMEQYPEPFTAQDYDKIDDLSLTYSETEFHQFREFLLAVGCMDGQIFYDLGSGAGKVLVAAALSGICFVKVIGIEILSSLIQVSRDVIDELTSRFRSSEALTTNVFHPSHHDVENQSQMSKRASGFPLMMSPVVSVNNTPRKQPLPPQTRILLGTQLANAEDLSIVSSSTYSYQVPSIADLNEKLRKAKISLPRLETR